MKEQTYSKNSLSLADHLEELRSRIFICLGFVLASTLAGFIVSPYLLELIRQPSIGIIERLIVTKPTEAIIIYFKISLYVGIILSSPVIYYQFWQFIRPAVPSHVSVSFINWFLPVIMFFLIGTVFTYYVIIPTGLKFLVSISKKVAYPMFTLSGYASFVLALIILGGFIFEMPILSAFLTRIGIISPSFMRRKRKESVFTMIVFAAVFTPTTDVFNMALFVMPMLVLYEVSILSSLFIERSINKEISGEVYSDAEAV